MNQALSGAIGNDPDIELFDAFSLLNEAVVHPSDFGLSNVTDACAQFIACDPSQYLFWDGIHPTSAAEPFISDAILSLAEGVPEPSSLGLLLAALAGFGLIGRSRAENSWPGKPGSRPRLLLKVLTAGSLPPFDPFGGACRPACFLPPRAAVYPQDDRLTLQRLTR